MALAALWVRSYRFTDWVLFGTRRHTFQATGARGHVVLCKATRSLPQSLRAGGLRWASDRPVSVAALADGPQSVTRAPLGVSFLTTPTANGVAVPYWVVSVASAGLPALWLIRWYRATPPSGLCPRCGYDLRATPEKCPECGSGRKEA